MSDKKEIEYLTSKEISELVRVPLRWVQNNAPRIAGYTKISGAVRYKKSSVHAALAGGQLLKS